MDLYDPDKQCNCCDYGDVQNGHAHNCKNNPRMQIEPESILMVDYQKILQNWENSLRNMKSKIEVEKKKAQDATIKAEALQEQYWNFESSLDKAKELISKQVLPGK